MARTSRAQGEGATMRTRGMGRIYQPKWKDKQTGDRKVSETWWIQFNAHAKTIRESSHSTRRSDAVKLLKRRLGEVGRGQFVGQTVERTTFEDLKDLLLADYRINGKKSLDRMERAAVVPIDGIPTARCSRSPAATARSLSSAVRAQRAETASAGTF